MKPNHLLLSILLLLLLVFAAATSSSTSTAETTASLVTSYPPASPENQTIYNASKAICWSCMSEPMEFLYAHNLIRAAHREPPLAWDTHLAAYSRWWASQRWRDCALEHSFPEGRFTLGENIFWGGGSGWTPVDAVQAWAAEGRYYSYRSNSCQGGEQCGHYTQLVWRTTARIGCARVVCEDGDTFMTCNYDPPGNCIGQRPY